MMKRTAPRSTLRKIIKKHKPQLRLAANADLLVRRERGAARQRARAARCPSAPSPAGAPSGSGSAASSRAESCSPTGELESSRSPREPGAMAPGRGP